MMAIEIVEALPGMDLGKGYSKLSGDVKISPAVRGKAGAAPGAAGQKGGYSFETVTSYEEFNQLLEVGASLSAGVGAFSVSAKSKFAESCQVANMSTVCVLSFHAVNAYETFHGEVELAPDAEELLRLGDKKRFRERFGDCFVSGTVAGGESYFIMKIESGDTERDSEIAVAISASFGPFSASGQVDKKMSEKFSNEKIEILTWQTGGSVEPCFSLEELFERAKVIARQIGNRKGVPISVILDDYNELKLPMDDISSIEEANAKDVLRQLQNHYHSLLESQHDINYVLRHQDYFKNINVKALNEANKQIARDLNTIVERADGCSRDFSKCQLFSPTFPDMEKLLPERKNKSHQTKGGKAQKLQQAKRLRRDANRLEELAGTLTEGKRKTRLLKEAGDLERQALAMIALSVDIKPKTKKRVTTKGPGKASAASAKSPRGAHARNKK
jgi:hypothetical protein